LLKREKPMPRKVFVGTMLTMFSLFLAFLVNYIILDQPFYTVTSRPPFGKEPLQPLATLVAISLLVIGLVLVFTGIKRMESK